MAKGDTVAATNATAANGTFTIQPSAGVEWIIHNLGVSGATIVKFYDGTRTISLYAFATEGNLPIEIHLTNAEYIQMIDLSNATNNMYYNGVQSK